MNTDLFKNQETLTSNTQKEYFINHHLISSIHPLILRGSLIPQMSGLTVAALQLELELTLLFAQTINKLFNTV